MPLSQWSVQGHNGTPKKVTYLENFPAYIRNTATDNYNELLNELNQRNFYKPQGRPPDASVIRYALHLRYTSLQAYRLFFGRFLMPYLSLLNKIQQGGVDMLNVLKTLHEKGSFSCDCILMIDEMYLQKSAQYQSGENVEEGNLYKGIFAFLVVELKQSIPFVVQTIPEVTFNGQWLVDTFIDNIDNLREFGLCIRGIVTDNHSANVNTFSALIKITL